MFSDDQRASSMLNAHSHLKGWLVGMGIFVIICLVAGIGWMKNLASQPKEAPEANRVLEAQMELPFQVLVPAYLPKVFIREQMQVNTDKVGPNGEPMVELVYPTRHGDTLIFYEWLPVDQTTGTQIPYCRCACMSRTQCNFTEMGLSIGSLRVLAKVSSLHIVSGEEARTIIDTLGPAMNRQIFSSLKDVSVTYSVSPAVDVPINSAGIQELTLVVTPNGYSPEHFAVKKDVPVRLIFRQVGQVGCGDQLLIQYGKEENATLTLNSASDSQVLEFTPKEAGDFRFNCPHFIYRGVMTVTESQE
jgi:hypothetical protein